jgi:hypothetical protein
VSTTPEPVSEARLAEIEARLRFTTPAPWECIPYANIQSTADVKGARGQEVALRIFDENAQFIAHARQDVPALLAEVRRLRGMDGEVWREGERCLCRFAPDTNKTLAVCEFHQRLVQELLDVQKERDTANARELRYWEVLIHCKDIMDLAAMGKPFDCALEVGRAKAHAALVALPHREYDLHKARMAVVEAALTWSKVRGWTDADDRAIGALLRAIEALEKLEASAVEAPKNTTPENGGSRS